MGYYADGRANTAFDLNDSRFDRNYEFDSSARLKKASTGVEAQVLPRLRWHKQTVPTGRLILMMSGTMYTPHRYAYVPGNVTSTFGRVWIESI